MFPRKLFFALAPILLFLILVTAPILTMSRDMWDGTIIEYASMVNNYSGLKNWFLESGWFLQFPLSLFIIETAQVTGLSYKNTNALFVFFVAVLLFRETFQLCRYQFKFSNSASYYAVALTASFSTWGVLFSSVMSFHFACIALGLFSIKRIHKKSSISKIFGYLALVVSFSLQSQLVFLPVLSYLYDNTNQQSRKDHSIVTPSNETIFAFAIAIACFVILKVFFPAHGVYENYNGLISISPRELIFSFLYSIAFGTYLVPALSLIGLVFAIFLSSKTPVDVQPYITPTLSHLKPSLLLLLFISGAFSYVAVGKYSHFLDIKDWTNRQGMLLALPTSLFAALCFDIMYKVSEGKFMKRLIIVGSSILLVFQMSLLAFNLVNKLNRQIFVSGLEDAIRLNQDEFLPGALEIIGEGIPGPGFRGYEVNFLMYSSTGRADWWARIGEKHDASFSIPCNIRSNQAYQLKYVYNYDMSHGSNHTIVNVDVTGYEGFANAVRNVLRTNDNASVEVANFRIKSNLGDEIDGVCN